jgi:hypothetical protein
MFARFVKKINHKLAERMVCYFACPKGESNVLLGDKDVRSQLN